MTLLYSLKIDRTMTFLSKLSAVFSKKIHVSKIKLFSILAFLGYAFINMEIKIDLREWVFVFNKDESGFETIVFIAIFLFCCLVLNMVYDIYLAKYRNANSETISD